MNHYNDKVVQMFCQNYPGFKFQVQQKNLRIND